MKIHKKTILIIPPILLILSIPLRPYFTELGYYFSGALCIFLFLVPLITGSKASKLSYYEVGMFVFTTYLFFGILYAPVLRNALGVSILFLSELVSCFAVVRLSAISLDEKKAFWFIADTLTAGTVAMGVILIIVEHSSFDGVFRMGKTVWLNYGTYMAYTYPLTLSCIFMFYKLLTGKKNTLNIAITAFLLLCVVLSGTRKLLLIFTVFMGIYLYMYYRKHFAKLILFVVIIALILYIIWSLRDKFPFIYDSFIRRFENLFIYSETGNARIDTSTSKRIMMIQTGWKLFLEKPIWGHGTVSFEIYSDMGIYSHNNFIELLCNGGIIAFMLYYIPFFQTVYRHYKNVRCNPKDTRSLFFFSAMSALFVADMFTISYYRIAFILFYEMAAYYTKTGTTSVSARKKTDLPIGHRRILHAKTFSR